jgi:precorrin-8X methylmutase (EC 5.4.1.2)
MQTKKGQSIEDASMKMIEDEIGSHNYNEKEWPIVRRIIHSTADFDFADKNRLIFSKGCNKKWYECSKKMDAVL